MTMDKDFSRDIYILTKVFLSLDRDGKIEQNRLY